MTGEVFQQRMLDQMWDHQDAAIEAARPFSDSPVPENIWRAYNIYFLNALADMLLELGVLEPG